MCVCFYVCMCLCEEYGDIEVTEVTNSKPLMFGDSVGLPCSVDVTWEFILEIHNS